MLTQKNYEKSIYFTRRSIRSYTNKPIEEWKVEALIKAFFQSQTASNQMAWNLIKVDDPSVIEEIAHIHHSGSVIKQAPLILVVTSDHQDKIKSIGNLDIDLGIAGQQLSLFGQDIGLGTLLCAISSSPELEAKFHPILNIPADVKVSHLIVVGYANETKPANDKYFVEKLHHNKW
jgi:nitroreductase